MNFMILRTAAALVADTVRAYMADNGSRMAAALAYYAAFALPSMLVLIVSLVGFFVAPSVVEGELANQIEQLVGPDGMQLVMTILEQSDRLNNEGFLAAIFGAVALAFGGLWTFLELQAALNNMWAIESDPSKRAIGDWLRFIGRRILSFLVLVVIALFLLLSLLVSTTLAAFGTRLTAFIPFGLSAFAFQSLEIVFSLAILSILYAATFRIIPDARIRWKDVWIGAFVTAGLFQIGKVLIGLYLTSVNVGTAYGAAGSLVVILIWIYYSTVILYMGAEFTHVWVQFRGRAVRPRLGAIRVDT